MLEGKEYLNDLPKNMRYARVSEASTLFINKSVAKNPPYLKFAAENSKIILEDFDGKKLRKYLIIKVVKSNKDITIYLQPVDQKKSEHIEYIIYPYWDIDDTYVVIQKIPGQKERPVKWAIPEKLSDRIEVFPDGYP